MRAKSLHTPLNENRAGVPTPARSGMPALAAPKDGSSVPLGVNLVIPGDPERVGSLRLLPCSSEGSSLSLLALYFS